MFYKSNYFKALNSLEKAFVNKQSIEYNREREKKNKEIAEKREKIILFYRKNGISKTQEVFKVKRTTLYDWQKKYKEDGINGLINKSRVHIHKTKSRTSQEIKDFIKSYRQDYGNIYQNEIKPHLDDFCRKKRIKTTSISNIGKIIRELKDKGEINNGKTLKLNGKTGNLTEYKRKKRRKGYYPKKPGDLIQVDSLHLDIYGRKRYLINAIDIKGRLAFSYQYKRLNNKNVVDFFKRLRKYYPFKIKRIQTDNGKEFDGLAHAYLIKNKLTHYWNYPARPESNGHIERFNRTIKEQFVYRNEGFLHDCQLANQKIKDYLFWYNTQKYHKSLNYETPIIYTLAHLNPN
jgi:transposase InsO family protein